MDLCWSWNILSLLFLVAWYLFPKSWINRCDSHDSLLNKPIVTQFLFGLWLLLRRMSYFISPSWLVFVASSLLSDSSSCWLGCVECRIPLLFLHLSDQLYLKQHQKHKKKIRTEGGTTEKEKPNRTFILLWTKPVTVFVFITRRI